jgi:hypothetical protein
MPALKKIGAAALSAFGFTSGASAVTANYLIVAGGGGGGGGNGVSAAGGGGGGAGGYQATTTSLSLTTSYTVVVGAGGAGGTTGLISGFQGSNSTFGTLTASVGGGAGAAGINATGGNGGSGGGGSGSISSGGSGTTGQGNNGGSGAGTPNYGCGGGGGANAVGANGTTTVGGNGGNGNASSISGTSVTYAGGGGGGMYNGGTAGSGGTGGGGNAGTNTGGNGNNGTANLGGGGGGAGSSSSNVNYIGGQGGSGIVIVSYTGAQQFGGGVVTSAAGNTIHTFYTSGVLSPLSSLSASYLIVAGGGGGGSTTGGGGGAGGLLSGSGTVIDTNSTYVVTVGAGGNGGTSRGTGSNGANSSFSLVTAALGGGGGGGDGASYPPTTGGSGGGGGWNTAGASGTSGQGNAGGTGANGPTYYPTGGGGGAGQAGGSSSGTVAASGYGGNGSVSSISGTATYYAGGGGGGADNARSGTGGAGGIGGGGNGSTTGVGGNATANTGGGGGGACDSPSGQAGGSGGSGIVIIAYAGSTQQMSGGTVTVSGGNVIHTFTSSGYLGPLTNFSNSLRFRSSGPAYLSRTTTTPTSAYKFTHSAWVKRGTLSGYQELLWIGQGPTGSANYIQFFFNTSTNTFLAGATYASSNALGVETSAVFRDPSAWYHFVIAVDTTQATAANRVLFYVNGVQQATTFSTNIAQNTAVQVSGYTMQLGSAIYASAQVNNFDGYMTNINFVDGQQLTPNSFGSSNQYGNWVPVTYGGSYGTNGFFLPFISGTSSYAAGFNGSSQYLSWTTNMAGLQFGTGDFTLEAWVNKSGNGTNGFDGLMQYGAVGGAGDGWYFEVSSSRGIYFVINSVNINYGTWVNDGYWHHVAIVRSSGVVTIYKDGVALLSQTLSTSVPTSGTVGNLGRSYNGTTSYNFNGYISNARIVKGTAVYTANFTPSTTPLTAITNTQLLTLQNSTIIDNSTNSTALTNNGSVTIAADMPLSTAVFQDQSPQGNNWTPNNFGSLPGATLDYMTDVPTLSNATSSNYAVLNPLFYPSNATLSNGNLNTAVGSTIEACPTSTMAIPLTGKYYYEVKIATLGTDFYIGVSYNNSTTTFTGGVYRMYDKQGRKSSNAGTVAYGATYTSGDLIGVAVDMDSGSITFYKNNTSQGVAYTNLAGLSFFATIYQYDNSNASVNFGQQPFVYTPPSGYLALNAFNL